jgi:hypothetical protein
MIHIFLCMYDNMLQIELLPSLPFTRVQKYATLFSNNEETPSQQRTTPPLASCQLAGEPSVRRSKTNARE